MNGQMHTLVVDDQEGIRYFLTETLERAGHRVVGAASGEDALARLRDEAFDLIMLDLKLGGRVDGMRVLESVRWRWPQTIVIILTAHGSLDSALTAIREGVDGYLLKPVEPGQVRQAVKEALERRSRLAPPGEGHEEDRSVVECGPFVIDLEKHVATREGMSLELTPREFSLLVHLIRNEPQVISPTELVRVVRQYEAEHPHEAREIIKWYIHRLRQKVEPDPSEPIHVINVRGVGYRFSG
ncbi:MAG: response regulator transcription factor [Anaerolineae bacterium]|jgi:DNA-binding response OmpR family regulator